MSKFSNYLEEKILSATLQGGTFPTIAGAHLAIFTSSPGEDGSGTECSYTGYGRQAMTFGASNDGVTTTSGQIQFPALTGATPVTVTDIGIYDAATGGNLLYYTNLQNSKTLTTDDVLSFASGGVTVEVQ